MKTEFVIIKREKFEQNMAYLLFFALDFQIKRENAKACHSYLVYTKFYNHEAVFSLEEGS